MNILCTFHTYPYHGYVTNVGKVIHNKFYKKFKFNHTSKWYMHTPASVLEKETKQCPLGF